MNYFNDIMKRYITHYANILGYEDIVEIVLSEQLPGKEMAARLVAFSDKFFDQGAIDAENEVMLDEIDIDTYDIEKTCIAICSFVDAQGYGELLDLS